MSCITQMDKEQGTEHLKLSRPKIFHCTCTTQNFWENNKPMGKPFLLSLESSQAKDENNYISELSMQKLEEKQQVW